MLRKALEWVHCPAAGCDSVVLRRRCLSGRQKTEAQSPPSLASVSGQAGGRVLEPEVVGEEAAWCQADPLKGI